MQWGAWGGTGMAVVHNLLPRIIKSGLGVLDPVAGMSALLSVMRSSAYGPQLVVSPFDWHKLMAGAKGNVFPIFKEFEEWATSAQLPPAVASSSRMPAQVRVSLENKPLLSYVLVAKHMTFDGRPNQHNAERALEGKPCEVLEWCGR